LPSAAEVFRPQPEEAAAPEWRAGDRWVFAWTSGKDSGSRTLEVHETAAVNGVDYYIVGLGGGVMQYYTKQLHFAAAVQDKKVIARMVPPTPWFVWPLKATGGWAHKGVYEDAQGTHPQNDTFTLGGLEYVTVPAGRYLTFKVTRNTDRRDSDQYWYAPEARWYVRWLGQRGDVRFEEQLTAYQGTARATSSLPPSTR
jgi:hypothetical protein